MFAEKIEEVLSELSISSEEFSELLIRLLDYGVLCRDESQIESLLYDRYLQCSELVEDYLAVIKIRLQHDSRFSFVRIFPPGAVVPGMADDDHSTFNSGFRQRPSQQEVALILVLRVEYEKALRDGQVDDKGCVILALEGLAIAYLIRYNAEHELDFAEGWISIHPSITRFVNDAVLANLAAPEDLKHKASEAINSSVQQNNSEEGDSDVL